MSDNLAILGESDARQLLDLASAAKALPPGPRGRPVATSTLLRWILRGCAGRKLAAVRVGRSYFTSRAALAAFLEGRQHEPPSAVDDVVPDREAAAAQARALARLRGRRSHAAQEAGS